MICAYTLAKIEFFATCCSISLFIQWVVSFSPKTLQQRRYHLRESHLPDVMLTASAHVRILNAMEPTAAAQEPPTAPERDSTARGAWEATLPPALATPYPARDANLPALAEQEIAAARGYVEASRAPSTQKAYEADWRRFTLWCQQRATAALPATPALVAVYLSFLADGGLAPPSVSRALAAIAHVHRRAGHVPPQSTRDGMVITDALAGIRRSRTSQPDRKDPADAEIVLHLLRSIVGTDLAALRDRALIAFGMALATRRSELVALDVADLAWEDKGVRVTIRRSKTDQEAMGVVVAVPDGRRLAPLPHLRAWLEAAGITTGAIFRPLWKGGRVRDARLSDHAVARIIQIRAAAAGLDPARYAGHSLRAGFVTAAARAGADIWKSSKSAATNRCRCSPATSATLDCSTTTPATRSCRHPTFVGPPVDHETSAWAPGIEDVHDDWSLGRSPSGSTATTLAAPSSFQDHKTRLAPLA